MEKIQVLIAVLAIWELSTLNATDVCLEGGFDAQAAQLLGAVKMTDKQFEEVGRLLISVKETLQTRWPDCEVLPFGSLISGLGMQYSDLDVFVRLPNYSDTANESVIIEAATIFANRPDLYTDINLINKVNTPVLAFFHLPTQRYCDVTFKTHSGIETSDLVKYYLGLDDRVKSLAMIIKFWSKVHNLTGTDIVPNHCWLIFVIFYLQQKEIVPPVISVQRNSKSRYILDWNVGFNEIVYKTENRESLYELLGGFFVYYSMFDFDNYIVAPFIGRPVEKSAFADVNTVPDDYSLYKRNVREGFVKPLQLDGVLIVQDTLEHNKNIAQIVTSETASELKSRIKTTAEMFENFAKDRFLGAILNIDEYDETIPYREKYIQFNEIDKVKHCIYVPEK